VAPIGMGTGVPTGPAPGGDKQMTTMLTAPTRPAPRDDVPSARRARVAVHPSDLVDLLTRRPDLVGVYRPADVAVESISWSA